MKTILKTIAAVALGLFASTAQARSPEEATAAVKAALDELYPGENWKASDISDAVPEEPSGRVGDSIRTHPLSQTVPAKLTRTLTVAGSSPFLHLRVRSRGNNDEGDWVLRVLVNGNQVGGDVTVCSTTPLDYYFPLAIYVGKEVTLQLQNCNGGGGSWFWEVAFWDAIEIVESAPDPAPPAPWSFFDRIDWVGGGGDNTLASTTANWYGNAIPVSNNGMRFCSGAYGKTVTFDRVYNATYVFVAEADPRWFYNPATGEVHPVVWKATDPAYGLATSDSFRIAEGTGQYAAVLIKSGTYTTTQQWCISAVKGDGVGGGAGWMWLEGGTVNPRGDLIMADRSDSHARLIVGSGDPSKAATFIVPTDKWAIMSKNAGGDGQITLKAGGEFHCAYIASWSTSSILRFDGGTLIKEGDVSNQIGLIYGTEVEESKTPGHDDSSRKLEVTANGGTIDVKTIPTTLRSTVYLAEGAEDGVLTKLGSATLTLANAASGFGGTFRAAEGTLALGTVGESTKAILDGGSVTIGGGTLANLTLGGGFSASVAGLPAHTALAIKGGAELKIDDLTSSPLAGETAVTLDADVSAQNPITINLLNPGDNSKPYPIVGGLNLPDGEVDFVKLEGLAEGGLCFVEDGTLMLQLSDNVVASASWTNALGDNDPMKSGNWICYNAAGKVIPDVLPGKTVTLALNTDGTWASWPDFFTADSTIDLMGHNLTVPTLDKGKIIDSSVTEKYQLLDYIQSAGAQYIDTEYIHKANTKAVFDVNISKVQNTSYAGLFGSMSGDRYMNSGAWVFFPLFASATGTASSKTWLSLYGKETEGPAFIYGQRTHAEFVNNTATWYPVSDPTDVRTLTNPNSLTDGVGTLFVFNYNTGTTAEGKGIQTIDGGRYCVATLYGLDLFEGDTRVRQFVPALRISDGKVGLLDLANPGEGEFHENKGTGADFVPGAVTNAPPSVGELHVNVASGETTVNSAVTISGGIPLVKDGAGTLIWGGGTLTAATPIVITDGVFKMGVNTPDVFGNGGTITVKGKGQYDLNSNWNVNNLSPTFNRTFYIEGDGPDGKGAIVNMASGTEGGKHLKTVVLTGDATIGGTHRIDFRGDCQLSGEGHVLTIKNTGMVAFCGGNSNCTVDNIVVDGGLLQPCSDAPTPLTVKERIELKNGGQLVSWRNANGAYELTCPVLVSEGSCTIGASRDFGGKGGISVPDVEVRSGATLSAENEAYITGTLSGSGAITGANLAFSGNNACWHVDISGKTTVQKVDLENAPTTFLAGLRKVEITSDKAAGYYDLAPLKGLVSLDGVTLTVTEKTTGRERKACSLQIRDDRLGVFISSGLMLIFQ